MTENKHKLESNKWFTLEQALEIINNHKESKFKININNIYELFLKSDIALYIKLSYCKGKLSIPDSNIFIDEFHIDGMNYLRCEMLNAEDNNDSINVFYGYARVIKSPFIASLFEIAVFKDEGKLIIDTEYLDKFYLGLELDEKLKLIKLSPYKGNYLIRAEITKALYTDIESLQYYINSFSMRDIEILGYPVNVTQGKIHNKAGYVFTQDYKEFKQGQVFIIPKVFTDEVLAGRNKKVALKVLAEVKMLTPSGSKDLNNVYLHKIPLAIDPKRTRCYLVEQLDESTEDAPSE